MSIGFIHEITGRCNLACTFCYNPWPTSGMPEELSIEENCALLKRTLTDSKASWLTFTGGEPLLYEGLEEVMTFVHQHFPDIGLGLATNGVLLDASRLDRLRTAGLGYVEISLVTSEVQVYRRLVGGDHPDRSRHALTLARSRGLATTAATVLRSGMENELEDLIHIAFALGANRIALNRFVARGRGLHQAGLRPSLEELDRLLTTANRVGSELAYPIAITTPIEACLLPHERFPHLDFGPCICGESKWAIDSQGHLRTCELSEEILGDLKRERFTDLLESPRLGRFQGFSRSTACPGCRNTETCHGGCRFA